MKIYRADPADEFFTRERCHILELMNDAAEPDLSVARCRVRPGVTTELHALAGISEVYVVIEGQGEMEGGDDQWRPVGPMACVSIDVGAPQRIRNVGRTPLVFLALCRPRFVPESYEGTE